MKARLSSRLFVVPLIFMPLHARADDNSQASNTPLNEEVTARLDAIKAAVAGNVHVVDCSNTFVSDNIQRAMDKASTGDVVVVLPRNHMGITCEGDAYMERIDFKGKAIKVQSLAPDDPIIVDKTVIDGAQDGCVVVFSDHPGRDSVLNGLTIRNGSNTNGGGILCWKGCPTIRNCLITGNTAKDHGGGIHLGWDTNAVIHNCLITNNTAVHGGGIASRSGLLTISNCLIVGNRAVESGGGVWMEIEREQTATIQNCTIAANTAGWGGGGVKSWCEGTLVVDGCVAWGNEARKGKAFDIWEQGKLKVTHSDVQGGLGAVSFQPARAEPPPWSSDNIDAAPKFVSPSTGNYGLAPNSPGITGSGTFRQTMGYVHDAGSEFLDSLPPPTGCSREWDIDKSISALGRMSERRNAELLVFLESFQIAKAPPGILKTFHSSVLGIELVYADNWQHFMGFGINPVRRVEPRTWDERMREPVYPLGAKFEAPETEWKVTMYRIYDGTMADYLKEHDIPGVVEDFEFAPGLTGRRISEGASSEKVLERTAVDYVVVKDRRAIQIHAEFPVRTSHILLPYFDQVAHSLKMFEPLDDSPRPGTYKTLQGPGFTLEYPGDWITPHAPFDDAKSERGFRAHIMPADTLEPKPEGYDWSRVNRPWMMVNASSQLSLEQHKRYMRSLGQNPAYTTIQSKPYDRSKYGPGLRTIIKGDRDSSIHIGLPVSGDRFLLLRLFYSGDVNEWKDVFKCIEESLEIE